jgi:hypothetical protein
MAIFNSKLLNYQRVHPYISLHLRILWASTLLLMVKYGDFVPMFEGKFSQCLMSRHWSSRATYPPDTLIHSPKKHIEINGNSRILNWRYLPYIRPIFQAYVSGLPKFTQHHQLLTFSVQLEFLRSPVAWPFNASTCDTSTPNSQGFIWRQSDQTWDTYLDP